MTGKKPGSTEGLNPNQTSEKDKDSRPEHVTTKRGLWMRANYIISNQVLHGKKGNPHWRAKRDEIYRDLLKKANL